MGHLFFWVDAFFQKQVEGNIHLKTKTLQRRHQHPCENKKAEVSPLRQNYCNAGSTAPVKAKRLRAAPYEKHCNKYVFCGNHFSVGNWFNFIFDYFLIFEIYSSGISIAGDPPGPFQQVSVTLQLFDFGVFHLISFST